MPSNRKIFFNFQRLVLLSEGETHDDQCQAVFHEGRAATEEACYQNENGYKDENVNANVVRVDVEDGYPFFKAGLDANPNREGKQSQSDELK